MATLSERLRQILSIRGVKQVDVIESTGITKGALSSYITGRYVPKQDKIYILAKYFDVSEAWLMGYDVPMERRTAAPVSDQVDFKREELIKNYDLLNDEGKENLLNQSRLLLKSGYYDRLKGSEDLA